MPLTPTPAGSLDTRITLQQPVTAQESTYGSTTTTWSTVGQVWAAVQQVSAAEQMDGQQGQQRHTVRADVRIRHLAALLPTWRVVIDGRVYQINGVTTVGRRQYQDLACSLIDNLQP